MLVPGHCSKPRETFQTKGANDDYPLEWRREPRRRTFPVVSPELPAGARIRTGGSARTAYHQSNWDIPDSCIMSVSWYPTPSGQPGSSNRVYSRQQYPAYETSALTPAQPPRARIASPASCCTPPRTPRPPPHRPRHTPGSPTSDSSPPW